MKRLLSGLLLCAASLLAGDLEFYGGFVFSAKEDIYIMQRDPANADIIINDAKVETKVFTPPVYYGIRYRFDSNWEIEHTHMKIYVDNAHPDVQRFEITDGYNFFFLNKFIEGEYIDMHIGFGPIITHPDIIVYGKTNYTPGWGGIPAVWDSNYRFSGWAGQFSLSKRYFLTENFYLLGEAKFVLANADVPIYDGIAFVDNKSLHLNYGIGYKF